jgi:hypothetical protein
MLGSAKEWVFEETGLSFQVPDNPAWQKMESPKPEVRLILQRTDKAASFFLTVSEASSRQKSMDEEYAKRFEKQYYSHPGVIRRSGEFFDFHGKRAYKMTGEMSAKDATLKTVHILWIDGGRFFQITLMKRSSNPLDDATIKAFVDSAKFNRKA